MRRTLLAVGLAVLVSMAFTPHEHHWRALDTATFRAQGIQGHVYWTPEWCADWYWFPIFWLEDRNPILWSNFVGQTAFVAVLAAMIANIHWRADQLQRCIRNARDDYEACVEECDS